MKFSSNIVSAIRFVINQPLSILRLLLPILIGKKLISELRFVSELIGAPDYQLAKTWFTSMLPDSLFIFDASTTATYHSLIIMATIGASIGLLGRLNMLILAFFSFFLYGIGEGIGIFDHHVSLPTQVLLALALVPGSMKLSIDYILLKYFYKNNNIGFGKKPKWGLNLILMLVALTYFSAGLSKLRYGHGIHWMDGATLGFYLNERTSLYKQGDIQLIIGDSEITEEEKWKDKFGFIGHTYANYQTAPKFIAISGYIANSKSLLMLLAIGSVMFELLAFIVFINSKYRNIYLISAILFHISIGTLMGISFRQYQLICFCLLDWNLIFDYIISKLKQVKYLIYSKLQTI